MIKYCISTNSSVYNHNHYYFPFLYQSNIGLSPIKLYKKWKMNDRFEFFLNSDKTDITPISIADYEIFIIGFLHFVQFHFKCSAQYEYTTKNKMVSTSYTCLTIMQRAQKMTRF